MYPGKRPSSIHHSHHSIPGLLSADTSPRRGEVHTTDPIIHSTSFDRTRYMTLVLAVEPDTTVLASARPRFVGSVWTVAVVVVDCGVGYNLASVQTREAVFGGLVSVIDCLSVIAGSQLVRMGLPHPSLLKRTYELDQAHGSVKR